MSIRRSIPNWGEVTLLWFDFIAKCNHIEPPPSHTIQWSCDDQLLVSLFFPHCGRHFCLLGITPSKRCHEEPVKNPMWAAYPKLVPSIQIISANHCNQLPFLENPMDFLQNPPGHPGPHPQRHQYFSWVHQLQHPGRLPWDLEKATTSPEQLGGATVEQQGAEICTHHGLTLVTQLAHNATGAITQSLHQGPKKGWYCSWC